MGKVYLKTKFDNEMKIEIPHSVNIANAMYGFRELGAEIIPYHKIDEIYDRVNREDIVLDYIDQCNSIFSKFDIEPSIPDYPKVMDKFLGRKVWKDTINSISRSEEKWSAGYFVKPVRSKAFIGKIIRSISDLVGCGNYSEDYDVLVSEPLDICVTKDGQTLLVEINDAYSLGCYGLASVFYAKLISARWSQILGVKDEYHF